MIILLAGPTDLPTVGDGWAQGQGDPDGAGQEDVSVGAYQYEDGSDNGTAYGGRDGSGMGAMPGDGEYRGQS